MRLKLAGLAIVLALLCGCGADEMSVMGVGPSVTARVIDQAGNPVFGVAVTAYVGDVAKPGTSDAQGWARWWLNSAPRYRVVVTPPSGYDCEVCELVCANGESVTFTLANLAAPTRTPRPTETKLPTAVPSPTKHPTQVPTATGPTATPWESIPGYVVDAVSQMAQEGWGVSDVPTLATYLRQHALIPTGFVHVDTINGQEVISVQCGDVLVIEAGGQIIQAPFWAYAGPTCKPTLQVAPTSTATKQPTRRPTFTPAWTRIPGEVATVVPAFYRMFDYGTDYQKTAPELGPIGSVQWAPWSLLNPAPGVFEWNYIDSRLAKEQGLEIRLQNGDVVKKPVLLFICAYTSDGGGFIDWTPDWVGEPHYLTSGGVTVEMPKYDSPAWRAAYWDMVRAFGARYNDNDQVTGVVVTTGLDGETQPIKGIWPTVMRLQAPDVEYRFGQFIPQTMDVYREAFPDKPLFINNAPGEGQRMITSDYAATFDPPIGLKHSGMWTDLDSHQGYGGYVGSWDHIAKYAGIIPIWLESPFGLGDVQDRVWSLYAGLHYHPAAISLHPEYLETVPPSILWWASAHCGVTIDTTPGVWTVLRDAEFPLQMWGGQGVSGKQGDWQFWMERLDPAPVVTNIDDTIYGRQARNIQGRVWFRVADGFQVGKIEVTLKQQGQTWAVNGYEFTEPDTGDWIVRDVVTQYTSDIALDNAGLVHMVEAFRQ